VSYHEVPGDEMSAESVVYYLNRVPESDPNDQTEWLLTALGQYTGAELRELLYVAEEPGFFELMRGLFALSDESRRTVLERLRERPATAGELADLLPIARPGVSRHLRVLREAGLVDVHPDAQRRVYELRPEPLAEVDEWLGRYPGLWTQRLDALHTEVARGKREPRSGT